MVAKLWLVEMIIVLQTSGWGRRNIVAIFAFFYFSSLLLSVAATAPTRDFSEKNVFAISIK